LADCATASAIAMNQAATCAASSGGNFLSAVAAGRRSRSTLSIAAWGVGPRCSFISDRASLVLASATICPMSAFATPRSPGFEIDRALALASFIIEIGPCSPAKKTAAVTRSGASVKACHSSSVNADLSVIGDLL
jgi:hypothetical protein